MQIFARACAVRNLSRVAALAIALVAGSGPATAQTRAPGTGQVASLPQNGTVAGLPSGPAGQLTYADIAGLVEDARIVAVVEIRRQAAVDAARAPGLAPGRTRLYLEADTQALLAAPVPVGEELSFLADLPLTDRNRAPKLRRQRFVIFADAVPGRAGQLQLVQPDAMFPADPAFEARLREVIGQFAAGDVPPPVTGVRHVLYTPGNLAGESETQMFVETETGLPASISVVRRPNMAPQWGVSWSEIIDQSATAPAPGSVGWLRLACGLPRELPNDAFLTAPGSDRQRARADYQVVLDSLGPCTRTRG